jgi:Spy/CpxP family protein refolding chaperone
MMTKALLNKLGIALVGTTLVAFAAFAQGRPDGPKGHGGHGGEMRHQMIEKLAKRLNITDEQKAKIKALREQFKTQNASALADIKALREKMKGYMESKDKDNAKATRDQIKAKMEQLKPAREQLRAQMKAILTPDQLAELEKIKAERKAKMDERRKDWKGKHGQHDGTSQGNDNLK